LESTRLKTRSRINRLGS